MGVLTKIDLLSAKTDLLPLMERYVERRPGTPLVPISAIKGDGLKELLGELFSGLPSGPSFYPADLTSTQTERFFVAEVVREKLLERTRNELPYTTGVITDLFDESGRVLHLEAVIYVERKSQKGIVIGKGGRMIRAVGQAAREELETVLGTKIYLGLRVKVHPRWRDDPRILREMEPGTADLSESLSDLPEIERVRYSEFGFRISEFFAAPSFRCLPGVSRNSKLKTQNSELGMAGGLGWRR